MDNYIIVDSNVICRDFLLRSQFFRDLCTYLEQTKTTLVVPTIVFAEVLARYERTYKQAVDSLEKCLESGMMKVRESGNINIDKIRQEAKKEIEGYGKYLENSITKIGGEIADCSGPTDQELIERLTSRVRPFNSEGYGLGDTLVWYTTLRYLREKGPTTLVTADLVFYQNRKSSALHEELSKEIEGLPHKFTVNQSIQAFLELNWPKPDGIDSDFLEKLPSFEIIKSRVLEQVAQLIGKDIGRAYDCQFDATKSSIRLRAFYGYNVGGTTCLMLRFFARQTFVATPTLLYSHLYFSSGKPRECKCTVYVICELTNTGIELKEVNRLIVENPDSLNMPISAPFTYPGISGVSQASGSVNTAYGVTPSYLSSVNPEWIQQINPINVELFPDSELLKFWKEREHHGGGTGNTCWKLFQHDKQRDDEKKD